MEYSVIFCCGTNHEPDLVYFLEPNEIFKQRRLEILVACSGQNEQCHAFIAEFNQIKRNSQKVLVTRYKNQKAKKFVEKLLKKNKWVLFKQECGSKSNMNWIYGENTQVKNKKTQCVEFVQKAVDFNYKKKQSKLSIFLFVTSLHSKVRNLLCSFFYFTKGVV